MFSLSVSASNTVLTSLRDLADAGSGPALFKLYSGTVPANAAAALGGATLLSTLSCSDPCGTVSNGSLALSVNPDLAAAASGSPTFFRLTDSDGNVVCQGSVSDNAGAGDLKLATYPIFADGLVSISSASISV